MEIQRVYTKRLLTDPSLECVVNVDPSIGWRTMHNVYDLFKWKKVNVSIKNDKTGEVIFEGKDLEFPEHYSQNACDIIAKMYFRKSGVLDTGHETSMKQVVKRMVSFWVRAMVDDGIINDNQKDIIYDELAYMLLNQMWAPNSPQWFNTGLRQSYNIVGPSSGHYYYDPKENKVVPSIDSFTRTQGSACFIVGVNDTLVGNQSIMENMTTATRLFKYGSGVGQNWSKLRAVGEKLSGGGVSSGLMSFLKVYDRNAGAIKSGGASRRASVMNILDLDHPEIIDFIEWKAKEEDKVVALGKMGYDLSISGEAYETVSGQNVNNSISISDEFMRRVENLNQPGTSNIKTKWELKGRVDSSVNTSIDVGLLWDEICKSAWRCGDPGVQFTDSINKWNTCPNAGIIESSNPCFTGDMRILTNNGYIPIGELDGQEVEIINKDGNTSIGKVVSTGVKETIVLRLSTGKQIRCTSDHIFMTLDGGNIKAANLKGICPMPMMSKRNIDEYDVEYIKYGFIQGDGSLNRLGKKYEHHQGLEVHIGEADEDVLEIFKLSREMGSPSKPFSYYLDNGSGYAERLKELKFHSEILPFRKFPETYKDWSMIQKRSFIRGCFSANGSIISNTRVSYKATCREFAYQMCHTLREDFGLHPYITTNKAQIVEFNNGPYTCKESYDINIHHYDSIQKFNYEIGFIQEYKSKALSLLLLTRAPKVVGIRKGISESVYDFSEPLTHWGIVEGCIVHNCSEYLFLNNTSCNLASINLMKFYDITKGTFDIEGYRHAITLIQMVLEATIHWGQFPTPQIAEATYKYRVTGLGYTNLGSLLMSIGIPYDSDEGRSVAAILANLMTAQSYLTSIEMAKLVGAFPGYDDEKSMELVIQRHKTAFTNVTVTSTKTSSFYGIRETINNIWDNVIKELPEYGIRNASVSLLAPCGTIGFAMDCDSTSSEPFFSHLTYKKLVDGSWMTLINKNIQTALSRLGGYGEEQISDIVNYILDGDGKIEGTPHLIDKHLPIFDTASKCGSGKRYLSPEAHVKMVAVIQPHISMGISKTVNLPAEATVDDVKRIYMLAWKLGCKCIALYRDGSKSVQPLTTKKEDIKDVSDLDNMNYHELLKYAKDLSSKKIVKEDREMLPSQPKCLKDAVKMDGYTLHIIRSFYDDNRLGELFITVGKQGDTVKGLMEVLCILISKALQYGMPPEVISKIMRNHEFHPKGFVTNHPYIKSASSIPDLISKFIDISQGDYRYCQVKPDNYKENIPKADIPKDVKVKEVFGERCHECYGNRIVKAGTCKYCLSCGSTTGCS